MSSNLFELLEQVTALQDELAEQTGLADLGEMAGPLAHELNNYLNTVGLQIAVLEPQVPKNLAGDLTAIRKQGLQIAALVRTWQESRRSRRLPDRIAELNRAVREAIELTMAERGEDAPRTRLELGADLPRVAGSFADLKRLCTFLLRSAVRSAALGDGEVCVRTRAIDEGSLLEVEDTGPQINSETLARLLDPGMISRPGTNGLEWAVSKTLVQRFDAAINVRNGAEKGVIVTVEFPVRADKDSSPSPAARPRERKAAP
jgi:signal transduction histidine kinase